MADGQHMSPNGHINPIQVQKFLSNVDYPAAKKDLINKATEEGADDTIIGTLEDMPQDQFNNVKEVAKAIDEEE